MINNTTKCSRPAMPRLFLIAGIGALAVGPGLSGCNSPKESSVLDDPPTIAKLWSDDVGAEAIKSLGYDQAYLFRWQNGAIDGWVELDGDDGPKRIPLNDTLQAARPDEKPGRLEPRRISGFVVVALRKQSSAEWQEYDVRIEQRFKYEMDSVQEGEYTVASAYYRGNSHAGTMKTKVSEQPRTAFAVGQSSATLMKFVGGKSSVPWLELRLVPSADYTPRGQI